MKTLTRNQELINNYANLDLLILNEKIRKNGFDYFLVKRTTSKCIYSQNQGDEIFAYEVFKTKIIEHRKNMERINKTYGKSNNKHYQEYKESFPNDEEFGTRAWTLRNLEDAERLYNGLL